MSVELFAWLMSELGPTLFEVELHNWGEPLLGRNVYKFIEIATSAGVSTSISTNFSIPFDEERAERLVSSGLAVLGVSIDGATQEAYEKYRVRGDLSRILHNCRMVAEAKDRLGSRTPELFWSYHVFSHNVDEVESARQRAADIGMKFAASRGWVVGPETEGLESFPYPWGGGFPDRCFFLWFQAVVNNEGGVSPCCGTFYAEDDFDRLPLDPNVLGRTSFREIWNGANFIASRKMFFRREANERERRLVCFDCPVTADFDGWKAAIRANASEFKKCSSNDSYNFFWNRRPSAGPGLVRLRRSAEAG
jgi:MoaA/NifB/PqqE/SkfB family radical SAM enzyme